MDTTTPSAGQKVLLLWAYYVSKDHLMEVVKSLQTSVGDEKLVAVENMERLIICEYVFIYLLLKISSAFIKRTNKIVIIICKIAQDI